MERMRKDDHVDNGWVTPSNGVRKPLHTNFIELHLLETSRILFLRRHKAPTGGGPVVVVVVVVMMMMMIIYAVNTKELLRNFYC